MYLSTSAVAVSTKGRYNKCSTFTFNFTFTESVILSRPVCKYIHLAYNVLLGVSAAIMFAFQDNAAVKKVINALPRVGIGVKYGLPQTRSVVVLSVLLFR